MEENKNLPVKKEVKKEVKKALVDIYSEDSIEIAYNNELLNSILNSQPNEKWLSVNKYAGNSVYLPIDKVEYLLRKIFKQFKIEITGQGTAFNGVWVTVRVHYLHPVTNEWQFHDGIGAAEMQVKSGESASNLAMINKGALQMALPMAKSYAVKDACDHFGDLFGANLNRKNTLTFEVDNRIIDKMAEYQLKNLEQNNG